MQRMLSKKHIFICLLLCSLFFASGTGLLTATGLSSGQFNGSSISGGNDLSSMSGGMKAGHADWFAAADSSLESFSLSINQSRGQNSKSNSIVLPAIAGLITCLIYSSRLTQRFANPFNSLSITIFLHKKDGMK